MGQLEGMVVLVTDASSGIGRTHPPRPGGRHHRCAGPSRGEPRRGRHPRRRPGRAHPHRRRGPSGSQRRLRAGGRAVRCVSRAG